MGARSTCGRGGAECGQRRATGQCERGDGYTPTPHACCHVPPTSTKTGETGRTLPYVCDSQQRVERVPSVFGLSTSSPAQSYGPVTERIQTAGVKRARGTKGGTRRGGCRR